MTTHSHRETSERDQRRHAEALKLPAHSNGALRSEVLVDASGLVKTIGDLLGRPTPVELLDFCSVLESIVLCDGLVVVGNVPPVRNGGIALLERLASAGVIHQLHLTRPVRLGAGKGLESDRARQSRITHSTALDASYEVGRLLGAERESGLEVLPLVRQRGLYRESSGTGAVNDVANLFAKYDTLREGYIALRAMSRLPGADFALLPLPPLALTILSRSTDLSHSIDCAVELRDEYSQLREKMRDLRSLLADPTISPHHKLELRGRWAASWALLSRDLSKCEVDSIGIGSAIPELFGAALDSGGGASVSFDLSTVVRVIGLAGVDVVKRWRLRLLHRSFRSFMRTSDSALMEHAQRVAGVRFTAEEMRFAQALTAEAPAKGGRRGGDFE